MAPIEDHTEVEAVEVVDEDADEEQHEALSHRRKKQSQRAIALKIWATAL